MKYLYVFCNTRTRGFGYEINLIEKGYSRSLTEGYITRRVLEVLVTQLLQLAQRRQIACEPNNYEVAKHSCLATRCMKRSTIFVSRAM
jgi:hypothetical protein